MITLLSGRFAQQMEKSFFPALEKVLERAVALFDFAVFGHPPDFPFGKQAGDGILSADAAGVDDDFRNVSGADDIKGLPDQDFVFAVIV